MAGSVRVNLSVPADVHEVLDRVAAMTGQSVSGLVMVHLGNAMPEIRRWLRSQDGAEARLAGKLGLSGGGGAESASKRPVSGSEGLSRQVRRQMEREDKKGRR